ncbi:MAG: 4-(cytidine 5'-diphospho)-2-C-methyl-D-erythritol kinase [Pseudomonadota bacterium]
MAATSSALRETAYAKINLALHVRERLTDGYHRIETLFAFCADGDELRAEPAAELSLAIDGPFGEALPHGPENLVMRAAEALQAAAGVAEGAALKLVKNLPLASGVGGGSGDAASALRLLRQLWNVALDDSALHDIAVDLGADVPACLVSQICYGKGRGDELRPISAGALTGKPLLLVNSRIPVETGPVFSAWDGQDRGPLDFAEPLRLDPAWRNDLEAPARAIAPQIGAVLETLERMPGSVFVRMSGSGATCFALFGDTRKRDIAAEIIAADYPEWWALRTELR